jgi:hypothetical protein
MVASDVVAILELLSVICGIVFVTIGFTGSAPRRIFRRSPQISARLAKSGSLLVGLGLAAAALWALAVRPN